MAREKRVKNRLGGRESAVMIGRQFGRLSVKAEAGKSETKKRMLHCLCACGTTSVVCYQNLVSGLAKSCGCLRREVSAARMTTHGATVKGRRPLTWRIWVNMIQRCENKNNPSYQKWYGARGITLCKRWHSYANFVADMGECPNGLTIERKNNERGYSPSNCKWATWSEQNKNKRNSQRNRK